MGLVMVRRSVHMFTESSIGELEVPPQAPHTKTLHAKLVDIDADRIGATDAIVLRKAVLGLITIVAELEQRLAALDAVDTRRGDRDGPPLDPPRSSSDYEFPPVDHRP